MSELKIEKKNAIAAYRTADADVKKVLEELFGKDNLLPVNIMERIKTFEDVLIDQGTTQAEFDADCKRRELDEDEIANKAMKLITACLNEGPLDPSKTWYFPVFKRDAGFGFASAYYVLWYTTTDVGERRSFKSSELAMFAGRTFPEIYKPFMLILNK